MSAPPLRLRAENDGIESDGPAPAEPANDTPAEARPPRPAAAKTLTAAVEKELLTANESGQVCGRSAASWWRDHAAARVPLPVRLGGSTRWRRRELLAWIEAGCPDRRTWEARQQARKAGR